MRSLRESSGAKVILSFLAFATLVWGVGLYVMPIDAQAASRHTEGTVVLDGSTVWYIGATEKRGFRTAAEFLSHGYSFANLPAATDGDRALTTGDPMMFADGTLVNDNGTVYMVNQGEKRGFTSAAAFTGLGFSFANLRAGSSADFTAGATVNNAAAAHPAGTLVLDGSTVYQVRANGKAGVPSLDVFTSYGWSFGMVVAANAADRALATLANVSARANGGSVVDDGTTPPVDTGSISASVASSNPASTTLVATQQLANLAEFSFSGSGTITKLNFKRIGVSADTTLEDVFVFDGAQRLTDSATVSSGSTVNFTGLNIAVSGSKTLSVKADIAASTSGETVGISLTGFNDNTVSLSGNLHTIASSTLAGVAIASATGSVTEAALDQQVWGGTLTVSTRDVSLTRLALRQVGSIPSADINNFKLLVDGTEVAAAASLDSNNYVTFNVSPAKTLTTGSRVLRVQADVIGGSNRTVEFDLRGSYDLNSTDTQFNVGVEPTGTFPFGPASSTVTQGSMTVVKASDSPSGNITNAGTDVLYGKYTFTAFGESTKVETLTVGFDSSGTDADETVRNVRIMVNGAQVGSTTSVPAADAHASGTSFTTNFVVSPGSPATVEIKGDVFDNEGTNDFADTDTLKVALLAGSNNGVRQTSLGSFNVPTALTEGNTLTISEGGLAMAKTTTYADQSSISPQTAYKIASYTLTGNDVEDVNVNTFDLDIAVAGGPVIGDVTDVYIEYGSNKTKTSVKSTVTATGNTWSPSFTLSKNEAMTIDVFASFDTSFLAADTIIASLEVSGTAAQSASTQTTGVIVGQTITMAAASITATKDASAPSAQLVDDSGTVRTAAFKFTSVTDSYTITDITLTLGDTSAVSSVILKDAAGSTIRSQPPTDLTFNGISVPVAADGSAVVNVDLQMSDVGVGAGTTGASLLTTLTAFTATNSQGTSAAGTESNPAGNAMYVYKSVPLVTRVALPSTTLSSGTKTLAKFTVSSNGTGTVAWKQMMLDINKQGGAADAGGGDPTITAVSIVNADTGETITAAEVFQNADGTAAATCAESDSNCELLISIGTNADDNVDERISGAKTYEVKATIGGTLATNDYITVTWNRHTTAFAASAAYTSSRNDNTTDDHTFVWSDVSASASDTGTADWTDDYLVKNLPFDSWSMIR